MRANTRDRKDFIGALLGLLAATALVVGVLSAPAAEAAIKCWTKEDGSRECGDRIPPEYSQKEHEEVSKHGVTMREHDRAKTSEEIEAERQAAEAARMAEQAREEQQRADSVLLSTFSSVSDMEATRDDKVGSIDAQIKITLSQIEKLESSLKELEAQAQRAERGGSAPSDKLLKDIASVQEQIDSKATYVMDKQAERDAIQADFAADIERFRELKAQ